jgi:hypothetical protein
MDLLDVLIVIMLLALVASIIKWVIEFKQDSKRWKENMDKEIIKRL